MTHRKVRAGSLYTFHPVMFDRLNPPHAGIAEGEVCRVVNLYGCPKANTMGMCHVETQTIPGVWEFAGMVCTNSLHPFKGGL
jgi:hypothetical protein